MVIGTLVLFLTLTGYSLADVGSQSPEVYVGGTKYRSIVEYRRIQKRLLSLQGQEGEKEFGRMETDVFIKNLLELMLEKLSEEDLKKFLSELKLRKRHLFDFPQTYDPGLVQMREMIRNHAKVYNEDIGSEFDPLRVKTIYIDPKVPQKGDISTKNDAQNRFLGNDTAGSYRNFKAAVEEFKKREEGPLSKKYEHLETVTIDGILEIFR